MEYCSEELSQRPYGFINLQVMRAYWAPFRGQSRLGFVRAFHLSNHPKPQALPPESWDQCLSSMRTGPAGKEIHGLPGGHFDHPKGKGKYREEWAQRTEKGGQGRGRMDRDTFPASAGYTWFWNYVDLCSLLFVRIRSILTSREKVFLFFFFF